MKEIVLNPVQPTGEIMRDLEKRGLISLLSSENAYVPEIKENSVAVKTLYKTDSEYGSHKLIAVNVNRTDIVSGIGYHPDREDFLLISTFPNTNPLYLIISYLGIEELNSKIEKETVSAEDFILLRMKYCDPETSFFTMNPYVPHSEATVQTGELCPVFYVTEPGSMPLYKISFNGIKLIIEEK